MLALTTTTKCSYIFWLYSELKSNENQFSKFYPKNSVWGIVKWFSVCEFLQFIRKTPSAANHNYKANKKRPPCVKRIKNQVDCVYLDMIRGDNIENIIPCDTRDCPVRIDPSMQITYLGYYILTFPSHSICWKYVANTVQCGLWTISTWASRQHALTLLTCGEVESRSQWWCWWWCCWLVHYTHTTYENTTHAIYDYISIEICIQKPSHMCFVFVVCICIALVLGAEVRQRLPCSDRRRVCFSWKVKREWRHGMGNRSFALLFSS